jgi:hypothetical protein
MKTLEQMKQKTIERAISDIEHHIEKSLLIGRDFAVIEKTLYLMAKSHLEEAGYKVEVVDEHTVRIIF